MPQSNNFLLWYRHALVIKRNGSKITCCRSSTSPIIPDQDPSDFLAPNLPSFTCKWTRFKLFKLRQVHFENIFSGCSFYFTLFYIQAPTSYMVNFMFSLYAIILNRSGTNPEKAFTSLFQLVKGSCYNCKIIGIKKTKEVKTEVHLVLVIGRYEWNLKVLVWSIAFRGRSTIFLIS